METPPRYAIVPTLEPGQQLLNRGIRKPSLFMSRRDNSIVRLMLQSSSVRSYRRFYHVLAHLLALRCLAPPFPYKESSLRTCIWILVSGSAFRAFAHLQSQARKLWLTVQPSVCANKVVVENIYACSFTRCLWLLLHYNSRPKYLWQRLDIVHKTYSIYSLALKGRVCWCLLMST